MRARVERGQTVIRAVLLVAAVGLIGVLLYRQVSRMTTERVAVWVSATDLRVGQTMTPGLLKRIEAAPAKGAYVEASAIVGRALTVAKTAGQPFYPADLAPRPVAPALSTTIPAGRLLATVRVAALDLPTQELRVADRLDLILAGPGGVTMVAHDAYMMGRLNAEPPASAGGDGILGRLTPPQAGGPRPGGEALVLGLFPDDVFPLASAEASGRKIKIILHSDLEVKSGELLTPAPTPPPPPGRGFPAVEIIAGPKRTTIYPGAPPEKAGF